MLSIIFVYVILLFTFNSVTGALLLVFVIQGSIWINFSFPFITETKISFIALPYRVAIQMGATIDYAIVMMSRFNSLKETMTRKEAAAEAVKQSFATIFTSGSIMTTAGFLIAYMSTGGIYQLHRTCTRKRRSNLGNTRAYRSSAADISHG